MDLCSILVKQIADLLFEKQKELGLTLVLVTHDATLAARCDREIRVRSGLIEADEGAPELAKTA